MKLSPFRSRKLLDDANGQPCVLCGAVGTTVSAHLNDVALGSGTGIKCSDLYTAWLCQDCHDLYDGRTGKLSKREKRDMWVRASLLTLSQRIHQGILVVK